MTLGTESVAPIAIRIRHSSGITIALCAAETDPSPGDTYLDDNQHYALAAKFAQDHGTGTIYEREWAEMEKHKRRDAVEDLNRWLNDNATREGQARGGLVGVGG